MTLAKIVRVLVLAALIIPSSPILVFSQNVAAQSLSSNQHFKCTFLFKDGVSINRPIESEIYKYCDGMKPQTEVTVELHGVVTSERQAKWHLCASPQYPLPAMCRDGQTTVNTMGIEYDYVRPSAKVEISLAARTTASKDGFAFAWIADVGCEAMSSGSACDIELLPGATLTFSADDHY
jgi:hypothetical protein